MIPAWQGDRDPRARPKGNKGKGDKGKGKSKDKGSAKGPKGSGGKPGPARSPEEIAAAKAAKAEERRQQHVDRIRRRAICYWCEREVGLSVAPLSCVRFLPCEHIILCRTCAPKARRCPHCHERVEERVALREDGVLEPDPVALVDTEEETWEARPSLLPA